jgi:N-formylglutamate amidohydrolase
LESFDLAGPTVHPPRNALPVLLSVPHSGRDYPDWLDRLARHGRASLEPLEDPLVDRLAWRAIADGTGAIVARAPRAAIDCNRNEMELDPAVVGLPIAGKLGVRARGGLGIVPGRTLRHGALWRRAISPAEFEARLDAAHRPFHAAVAAALAAIKSEQGGAVLLDCHSMPPRPNGHPNIVIGDRHGHSASRLISAAAERVTRDHGYSVQRNIPYGGGWIVERHGAPKANVHALQIEIDRRCYLGADLRSPGAGFDRISHFLAALAGELGHSLMAGAAEAAE